MDNLTMGRSVSARRREQGRLQAAANSVALSAVGAGIAALIVVLTGVAAWIAALIAAAILVIGLVARESG
ncbi:MAG: hypothetical protein JOZ87_15785 [Chloroflexi bacterium]|nr:hypothetical protein [Chloroflexota bacterium]